MLCINCRKEIGENRKFCPFCGTKQSDSTNKDETVADKRQVLNESASGKATIKVAVGIESVPGNEIIANISNDNGELSTAEEIMGGLSTDEAHISPISREVSDPIENNSQVNSENNAFNPKGSLASDSDNTHKDLKSLESNEQLIKEVPTIKEKNLRIQKNNNSEIATEKLNTAELKFLPNQSSLHSNHYSRFSKYVIAGLAVATIGGFAITTSHHNKDNQILNDNSSQEIGNAAQEVSITQETDSGERISVESVLTTVVQMNDPAEAIEYLTAANKSFQDERIQKAISQYEYFQKEPYIINYYGDGGLLKERYEASILGGYKEFYYYYKSESQEFKEIKECDYDNEGKSIKDITYDKDNKIKSYITYEYNGDDLIRSTKYDSNNDITAYSESIYENGVLVESKEYYGDNLELQAISEFENDADGNLIKYTYHYLPDDKESRITNSYYDSQGNKIKEERESITGELKSWVEYEYKNNNSKRWTKSTEYRPDGTVYHVEERDFDEKGKISWERSYKPTSNTGTYEKYYEYIYNNDNKLLEEIVTWSDGRSEKKEYLRNPEGLCYAVYTTNEYGYRYCSEEREYMFMDIQSSLTEEPSSNTMNENGSYDNEAIGSVVVVVDDLNIRTEPSEQSDKVGMAHNGDTFEVYDYAVTDVYVWYKIGEQMWIADGKGQWTMFKSTVR